MSPRTFGLFFILSALFVIIANGDHLTPKERRAVDVLGVGLEQFSWNTLLRTFIDYPEENVVLSPFAMWSMLTVLSEGAKGVTLSELKRMLRQSDNNTQVVRDGFRAIHRTYSTLKDVNLYAVNTIFYDDDVNINRNYNKLIKQMYDTEMLPVNFEKPGIVNFINRIVSKKTFKNINNIVVQEDMKDSKMLITNAIHFKGQWKYPFLKSTTKVAPFFDEKKKIIGNVNMMNVKAPFIYVKSKVMKSSIVVLPFGKEQKVQMLIIIPDDNIKLLDVYQKFTKYRMEDIFAEYLNDNDSKDQLIDLHLPRFKITSDLIMNQILNNMGVYDIFYPEYAELSNISPNLFLSRVIHKANIDVVEEGTTSVEDRFVLDDDTIKVEANKPFMFVVIDDLCKSIVMGGLYRKPQQH